MGALLAVVALAAQAATTGESAPPTTPDAGPKAGSATYVDLEAGAGYSTNPTLSFNNDTGAGFGRVAARAVHTRVSARTTTVLQAFGQAFFYTAHRSSQQSLSLSARHDAAVNEKLRVFGDLDFAYDRGGQLDSTIVGVPVVPLPPGTTVPPPLLPPGSDFLTVTGRSYRASGHLGAQLALSPFDTFTVSSGAMYSAFKGLSRDTHYTTVPVSIGYGRRISPRTTIGAQLDAEFTDYNGPTSARIITPLVTIQTLLSENLSFNGGVGASFASIDDGVDTRHSTGVAGNANLCSTSAHGQFCARAVLDQQAATVAGPAKHAGVSVDYSRRLDADQTIRFSLGADRYSRPFSVVEGETFSRSTYVRAAADYSRKIGARLFGGVSLAARKVAERGPDPNADISASLFIRYRLGDLQ